MIFSDECDALNSSLHRAEEMASLTVFQMLLQSSDLVAAARSLHPDFHAPSSVIILLQKATCEFVSPVAAFLLTSFSLSQTFAAHFWHHYV
jgi:hypothetical protein